MEFYYHEIDNDVLVLIADGGLNANTAEQFVTGIENLVEAGLRKMIVDCARLTYKHKRWHKRCQEPFSIGTFSQGRGEKVPDTFS